jgi:hypothetical protein
MKRVSLIAAVGVVFVAWLAFDRSRDSEPGGSKSSPAGIEFSIPGDYTTLELGETTVENAAERLLRALDAKERVAAVFIHAGDRIQLLVNGTADTMDERVLGRHGTVRVVLWRGSVRERLRWAGDHGTFEAPGLPPPERRNPYH